MQIETVPPCPRCGLPEKCYKVSLLYLEASAWLNHQKTDRLGQVEAILREYLPEAASRSEQEQFIARLVKLIAPPAGEKRVLRQVHPDGMVGFFCLVSLVILFRAFSDQPQTFPLLVILFTASFTAYVILRRSIVSRYNQRKAQGQREVITIEKAVSRWMRSYFCTHDQGVFDPQTGQFASLDGLKEFFSID
jgi:hypothetical protein